MTPEDSNKPPWMKPHVESAMVGSTVTLPMQFDKERLEVITKGVPITGIEKSVPSRSGTTQIYKTSTPTKE